MDVARKLKGFDVSKYIAYTEPNPDNPGDERRPFIHTSTKLVWANMWAEECGFQLRVFTDLSEKNMFDGRWAVARCRIIVDEVEVTNEEVAQPIFDGMPADYYETVMQRLTTKAKSRALSNMGFDIPGTVDDEQSGNTNAAPAKIPAAENAIVSAEESETVPKENIAESQTQPESEVASAAPMTVEEAKKVVVVYPTKFANLAKKKTVGEVAEMEPSKLTNGQPGMNLLRFLAGDGEFEASSEPIRKKYPELSEAAKIVVADYKARADAKAEEAATNDDKEAAEGADS